MNIALVIMDGDPLPVKYEEIPLPSPANRLRPVGQRDARQRCSRDSGPIPFGFAGGLYDRDTKLLRFGSGGGGGGLGGLLDRLKNPLDWGALSRSPPEWTASLGDVHWEYQGCARPVGGPPVLGDAGF